MLNILNRKLKICNYIIIAKNNGLLINFLLNWITNINKFLNTETP
jgi:hypothetical protein